MRSSPSPSAEAIREIPAKVRLRALDFVYPFWKIEHEGLLGYISDAYIMRDLQAQAYFKDSQTRAGDTSSTVAVPLIHSTNEEVGSLPESRNSSTGAAGASGRPSDSGLERRASVRCSAYTKKGNRCQRMTTSLSGRCWQHER